MRRGRAVGGRVWVAAIFRYVIGRIHLHPSGCSHGERGPREGEISCDTTGGGSTDVPCYVELGSRDVSVDASQPET